MVFKAIFSEKRQDGITDSKTKHIALINRWARWFYVLALGYIGIKHPAASSGVLTSLFSPVDFQSTYAPRGGEFNPEGLNKELIKHNKIAINKLLKRLRLKLKIPRFQHEVRQLLTI